MPAMAPPLSEWWLSEDEPDAAPDDDPEDEDEAVSDGKASPGVIWNVAFSADSS